MLTLFHCVKVKQRDHTLHFKIGVDRSDGSARLGSRRVYIIAQTRVWLETRHGSSKVDSAQFLILWLEDSTSQSKPKNCIIIKKIKKSHKESLKIWIFIWLIKLYETFVMPMSVVGHYYEKKTFFRSKIQFKLDSWLGSSSKNVGSARLEKIFWKKI